jgi:hypothetical protein
MGSFQSSIALLLQGLGMTLIRVKMQRDRWLRLFLPCIFLITFVASPTQAWVAKGDLQLYFVEVEGGQSTLFGTPAGQLLLIARGGRIMRS